MPFFSPIALTSGIVAGLSLLLLPMWVLGVPGIEGDYARGWKMGLNVLLSYPVAWLLVYAPYFVMRNQVSEISRLRWQEVVSALAVVLLIAAAARMIQAFRVMI